MQLPAKGMNVEYSLEQIVGLQKVWPFPPQSAGPLHAFAHHTPTPKSTTTCTHTHTYALTHMHTHSQTLFPLYAVLGPLPLDLPHTQTHNHMHALSTHTHTHLLCSAVPPPGQAPPPSAGPPPPGPAPGYPGGPPPPGYAGEHVCFYFVLVCILNIFKFCGWSCPRLYR